MVEPKFTPGPWLYPCLEPHDDWGVVRAVDGFICQAKDPRVSYEQLNEYRANETDPYSANAHLIAAAPDLYEALYNVMLEFGPGTMSDAAFEGACVALAKARGETIDVIAAE